MPTHAGPNPALDSNIIFSYDVGDTSNSFRGKPTTNFYTNGHFSGGNGISQEGGSNATNTIIQLPNPGNSPYVLQQTMGVAYTEYQINLTNQLQSNTTYVLSGWYAESADYAGASRMFHCRAFSTSGAHVALGTGIGTVLKTVQIGGITWRLCYATITTPADYSNDFNWYVGYDGGSYTGARYYTNLMMEVGTTPSQFVDGTRSSTQGLLPLINNPTIDLSSVSFDSNAQIIWDGTDDTISINSYSAIELVDNVSIECVYMRLSTDPVLDIIANKYNGTGWELFCQTGATFALAGRNGDGTYYATSNPAYTIQNNQYYHLVAIKDGFSWRLYVNGQLYSYLTAGTIGTWSNSGILQIGGEGSGYYPHMKLPIFKIYNTVLSADQVQQNYRQYKSRFNLS